MMPMEGRRRKEEGRRLRQRVKGDVFMEGDLEFVEREERGVQEWNTHTQEEDI